MDYQEGKYKTIGWLNKREEIIKERKACEICGSEDNLELHHTFYSYYQINIEDYFNEDLMLLCSKCHTKIHKNGGGYKVLKGDERDEYCINYYSSNYDLDIEYNDLEIYDMLVEINGEKVIRELRFHNKHTQKHKVASFINELNQMDSSSKNSKTSARIEELLKYSNKIKIRFIEKEKIRLQK